MASKSYPRAGYNSGAVTELEHERMVHAIQPDGLIGHPDDLPLVYADGTGTRVVKLRANYRALVRGTQYDSGTSDISMASLAANASGQTRIDLIVLRLSRTDYSVTETAITGTPAASPVAPSPLADVGSTGSFDLPVAEVTVDNGATSIAAGKVKPVAWWIGDDGQILVKDGIRPPHKPYRVLSETDTGRTLVSNGTNKWLAAVEDSGVVTVTMESGYTAAVNRLQRRNGLCVLTLDLKRPAAIIPANTVVKVASLPTGFAPAGQVDYPASYPSSPGQAVGLRATPSGVYVVTSEGVGVNADRNVVGSLNWFPA